MTIYVVMMGRYGDYRLVGVCQRPERAEEIGREAWVESKGSEEVKITAYEEGQLVEYSDTNPNPDGTHFKATIGFGNPAIFPSGSVLEVVEFGPSAQDEK